jgi:hypothetical protein
MCLDALYGSKGSIVGVRVKLRLDASSGASFGPWLKARRKSDPRVAIPTGPPPPLEHAAKTQAAKAIERIGLITLVFMSASIILCRKGAC